jgi:chromosome condensin MukBEF MukE localization factor
MTRRPFYVALGATLGVLLLRRASQSPQRSSSAGVQSGLSGALGNLAEAVREFGAEVRLGMSEREDELRTGLGLDGTHDVVDAPGA